MPNATKGTRLLKPAKKTVLIAGVIDIGSNDIRLRVGQNVKGSYKTIEDIDYPLNLGSDTFGYGKISFEKADKCCEMITNYLKVCAEYGAADIRVVATTALREASNRDFILDQIRTRTGVNVRILDNAEEKYIMFRLMHSMIDRKSKDSALFSYIGSGSLGVSFIRDDFISYVQNIRAGSLRINEVFEIIEQYSKDYYVVVEDYLESFIMNVAQNIKPPVESFVVAGSDAQIITSLCKGELIGEVYHIPRERFTSFYDEIKHKSVELIMAEYGLHLKHALPILPAMCIYHKLLSLTNAKELLVPVVHLVDGLISEILYNEQVSKINDQMALSTLVSAGEMASRFGCDEEHGSLVSEFSLSVFDKLKKAFGLPARSRVLLRCAAFLHECGKFISTVDPYKYTYDIISNSDIIGLSAKEMEIIAGICYYDTVSVYKKSRLTPAERVLTAKLNSIFYISDSLDRSHKQKLSRMDVKLSEDRLTIYIESNKNTELEEYYFNEHAAFFEEVFGLKAVLNVKKVF